MMKKEEIVEILDKHLKTLIKGKEDEWFEFEEMKTMPEYNAVLNAMLEVAEKAVNKNCNLQNVINCPFCGSNDIIEGLTTKHFCNFCKEPF